MLYSTIRWLALAAFYLAGRASGKRGMGTKQLAYCAMALALSFVTSYIKPLEMPYGGSVTLMRRQRRRLARSFLTRFFSSLSSSFLHLERASSTL